MKACSFLRWESELCAAHSECRYPAEPRLHIICAGQHSVLAENARERAAIRNEALFWREAQQPASSAKAGNLTGTFLETETRGWESPAIPTQAAFPRQRC